MATRVHAAILRDAAKRPLLRMRAEHDAEASIFVMAGLRPGHPRLPWAMKKDVDARDKRGHDDKFQSSPFRDAPLGAGRNQPLQRCVALILRSALLRASRRMATWVHP